MGQRTSVVGIPSGPSAAPRVSRVAQDTTGLTYLNNRYYDPVTAVFISVDPLVAMTGQPYLYGGGSPTTLSDPTGLSPEDACLLGGGGAGACARAEPDRWCPQQTSMTPLCVKNGWSPRVVYGDAGELSGPNGVGHDGWCHVGKLRADVLTGKKFTPCAPLTPDFVPESEEQENAVIDHLIALGDAAGFAVDVHEADGEVLRMFMFQRKDGTFVFKTGAKETFGISQTAGDVIKILSHSVKFRSRLT